MDAMSVGSMVKEGGAVARAFRWDQPFRVVTSSLFLAALAGAAAGRKAVEEIASLASSLGAASLSSVLGQIESWVQSHVDGELAVAAATLGIAAGVATAGRGWHLGWGRAASTAVLSLVLGTYAWGSFTRGVFVAAAMFAVVVVWQWSKSQKEPGEPGGAEWAQLCLAEMVLAAFHLPILVVSWLLGGDRPPPARQLASAGPTGAVS